LDAVIAAQLFANYFHKRKVNVAADAGDWIKVRKLVNGGTNGLRDFMTMVARLARAVAVPQKGTTAKGER
jgi:predicted chitinase